MSCGVGCTRGSDPVWLWHRLGSCSLATPLSHRCGPGRGKKTKRERVLEGDTENCNKRAEQLTNSLHPTPPHPTPPPRSSVPSVQCCSSSPLWVEGINSLTIHSSSTHIPCVWLGGQLDGESSPKVPVSKAADPEESTFLSLCPFKFSFPF